MTEGTVCRWENMDDGLEIPELRRLKQPEEEKRKLLSSLAADRSLDKTILQEVLRATGEKTRFRTGKPGRSTPVW